MLVPVSAILRDDENLPFVYVAQPDGSFARQHVTLGYRTGDQYEIPEGSKPATRSWSTAASSFSSCKTNERPTASTRRRRARRRS
jgi:hypothetical protein